MSESRTPTETDEIAEAFVAASLDQVPETRVYFGGPGDLSEYSDYSPAGRDAWAETQRGFLERMRAATPVDDIDRVTQTDFVATLDLDLRLHAYGLHFMDLNVIASPAQEIRSVFDLMPMATAHDWGVIAQREAHVAAALDGYIATLRSGIQRGLVPAKRQVTETAAQVAEYAKDGGFFDELRDRARTAIGDLDATLDAALTDGASSAKAGYARLAAFLKDELLQAAREDEAFGRDLYALLSERFVGDSIDLDETYEWGLQELARMVAEQEAIAQEIVPGGSVADAIEFLEADDEHKLHGTDALQKWMQERADEAIRDLAETSFDIDDRIRVIECMIAPTNEGGIYYTPPSEDFSRPGRMWWSVPEGVETFDTWRELTTVYHEGVPGHHLQLGQAVAAGDVLNRWRRSNFTSGHGEGWALYAERFMDQLGYLKTPADRFGMLDAQRMRAARVVLDIGVHLKKPRPDGAGEWTPEYAFEFMAQHVNMSPEFIRFEVNRYLGWPGQAPSYKIGQRVWEELRDALREREGDAFDLKAFHSRALRLGGVRLATLRSALLGEA